MASLGNMIITEKGHSLMAKKILDEGAGTFTKVRTSSIDYRGTNLESLSELQEIKQEVSIRTASKVNEKTVKAVTILTNEELTEGYHLKTVGLYANDPDEGEILYAVAIAEEYPDYIPAFNNFSISEITFNLYVTVSNADTVTIDVDLTSYATVHELNELKKEVSNALADGAGSKIYLSDTEPENLKAGDWWYEEITEQEGYNG